MRFQDLALGRLMMFPDHVFGRRWIIQTWFAGAQGFTWGMLIDALPEEAVIWRAYVRLLSGAAHEAFVQLALGEALPVAAAEFGVLELLCPTIVARDDFRSGIDMFSQNLDFDQPMRMPIHAGSRRLVVQASATTATSPIWNVGILVSSIPRGEVPVCLL